MQEKINDYVHPQFDKMSRAQLQTADTFYREKMKALKQAWTKLAEEEKIQSKTMKNILFSKNQVNALYVWTNHVI